MATKIRPEISSKNRYWISKHRHYELKHFCLQYPEWKRSYLEADGFGGQPVESSYSKTNRPGDPTGRCAEIRDGYFKRMELVEQAAVDADPELSSYIIKAVTEGLSYNQLKARFEIPCGRDMYYDRYRRFFWLLDKARD